MAYRLLNCCDQALRVDLRGGASLLLEAGAMSPVLREELLYDNVFVEQWLGRGLLQRLPASLGAADLSAEPASGDMDEEAAETATTAGTKTAAKAAAKKAPAPKTKGGKGGSP